MKECAARARGGLVPAGGGLHGIDCEHEARLGDGQEGRGVGAGLAIIPFHPFVASHPPPLQNIEHRESGRWTCV